MPYIFAGLEIAMIFALIGAIVAEFVGAQSGLGMLMQSMNFTMDVAGQFSVLLILSVLGLLLNGIVDRVPPPRAVLGSVAEARTPMRRPRRETYDEDKTLARRIARSPRRIGRRRGRGADAPCASAGAPAR